MRIDILKKVIIASGVFLFLLGIFMIISHINYGVELFIVGMVLLPTGLLISIQNNKEEYFEVKVKPINSYPTINQSIGITGMIILGMLLVFPLKEVFDKLVGAELSSLIGYILPFGIVFAIIYGRKSKINESLFNLSLENKRIIPFIIVSSIILNAGIGGPLASLIPMPESIVTLMLQYKEQTGIWTLILMVIAAPVLEELIFRGVILDGLLKRYTPLTSILISSVLFGIAHFNPWQLVTASLIGALSGWVYYKTKSLAPCIIIHSAVNLFGYLSRYFMDMDSAIDESLAESIGTLNFILVITGSTLIVFICIYNLQKEFNKEKLKIGVNNQL